MSRFTTDQLRDFLDAQFQLLLGTVDPSDEQVLEIYSELQRKLYPTRESHEAVRSNVDREEVKKLRRAVELVYPWVREDNGVRGIQKERKSIKAVTVIPERENSLNGVVILHDARVSGQSDVLRFEGIVPNVTQKAGKFAPERPLPLHVLLTHLVQFEQVLDIDTPVRVVRVDAGMRPTRVEPQRVGSAMPLSAFLERL